MIGTRCRIVTWNCRRAGRTSPVWDYLLGLSPDIALLQEVSGVPTEIASSYSIQRATPITKYCKSQRFKTVILARGSVGEQLEMPAPSQWVAGGLILLSGNLPAFPVQLDAGMLLHIICIYSPAWSVAPSRLEGIDVSGVKLMLNRNVWVADLLWASLNRQCPSPCEALVLAGDFNLSETFDQWPGGPRGNREYLDRMASLGLTECLRESQGRLTPTYRNPRGGAIKHQMDHVFVTAELASRLVQCRTGSEQRVFGGGLSDHLPIIADFAR
jgi:hypothetical protein